jgi:small subunit ribosomal protein S17
MKTLTGKVVSNKTPKMVVVEVEQWVAHPLYHKRIRRTRKFHAHVEITVKNGDVVKISETKPISKTQNWKVTSVVDKEGK